MMSASAVVVYAGEEVTSTIQEKCNLPNIRWLNVEESEVNPFELKLKKCLFLMNKRLLSFLRKRKNHQWMKFLEEIAHEPRETGCTNDLNQGSASTPVPRATVIFTADLTEDELDDGQDLFQGIEEITVPRGNALGSVVMQRLALISGATAPIDKQCATGLSPSVTCATAAHSAPHISAADYVLNPGATAPTHIHSATPPLQSQGATAPCSSACQGAPTPTQGATAPCSSVCQGAPTPTQGATGVLQSQLGAALPNGSPYTGQAFSPTQGATGVSHPSIPAPSIPWHVTQQGIPVAGTYVPDQRSILPNDARMDLVSNAGQAYGYSPMSSYVYVRASPSELDPARSLSSRGLDLGRNQALSDGSYPSSSHFLPNHPAAPVAQRGDLDPSFIPPAMSQLSIGGNVPPQQADTAGMWPPNQAGQNPSGLYQYHVPATDSFQPNSQHFNISPNKSWEENNPSANPSLLGPLSATTGGEGGASHVDLKPTGSGMGDTSGDGDDERLMLHLPVKLMQYLSSEMDVGSYHGRGWIELAAIKGYLHSQVVRIRDNNRIPSPFQYLLSQQEFSGYTYGQFKKDLQVIPRLDILKKLQTGNYC